LGDRESAGLYLDSFLKLPNVRAENLVAVSRRLLAVGAETSASRVLSHAIAQDPLNQPALSQLIEIELSLGDAPDLTAHLARLMEMRRPSPTLLRACYERLSRDRFIFMEGRSELLQELLLTMSGKKTLEQT
jgi:hypothetical protein